MPAIGPPRIITIDLAARLGISRSRVRTELAHGTWRRLAVGVVLTRPDDPTREDWADLGLALAGTGAAISGWDAVRARGFGDRRAPSDRVLVVSGTAMNRLIGDVRIRRTCRSFLRQMQPLDAPYEPRPLVGLARAVTDTALQHGRSHRATTALVAAVLMRRACDLPELIGEYRAGPRRDSAGLHRALEVAADGARSVAEADAARRLAAGPIPPFELNVPIVDQRGNLLYVVDELWRELRAAVEIDSREYHADPNDWEHMLARHNDLTRWGLAVLHYPPKLVTAPGSRFVRDVGDWLHRRSDDLGVAIKSVQPRALPISSPASGVGNARCSASTSLGLLCSFVK